MGSGGGGGKETRSPAGQWGGTSDCGPNPSRASLEVLGACVELRLF